MYIHISALERLVAFVAALPCEALEALEIRAAGPLACPFGQEDLCTPCMAKAPPFSKVQLKKIIKMASTYPCRSHESKKGESPCLNTQSAHSCASCLGREALRNIRGLKVIQ